MKFLKNLTLKIIMLVILIWPAVSNAQVYFTSTGRGDVNAGFRKEGQFQEKYETVVYLGNVSNYLALPAGTVTNIWNFSSQLATMCPDHLTNLQWSVFATFVGSALTNSSGVFPPETCWYTVPRTNVSLQTISVQRFSSSTEGNLRSPMLGISSGANQISQDIPGGTNANNNTQIVLEPITLDPSILLTTLIGDGLTPNPALGDFDGEEFAWSAENTNFGTPTISDFYVNVPAGSGSKTIIDPITGLSNGNADYLGYFTFNNNGAMTFTRASAVTAPSAGTITSSATNGFFPLQVTFTNSATGSITNWVWNFGDGTSVTNTTSAPVTHIYSSSGNFSVTLTVYGPGGSSTVNVANYIVTSLTPKITPSLSAGKFVLGGTNCPPGVQYRILNTTNLTLPLASWIPVTTNNFLANGTFSYTNSTAGVTGFFRLISP